MVVAEREQNWMIYSLPRKRGTELEKNLKCLQDACKQILYSSAIFANWQSSVQIAATRRVARF